MKQMEISFSQILEHTCASNPGDEHTRWLENHQASMDAQDGAATVDKYEVKTGKMNKKEMKELAAKNKSVKERVEAPI